MLFSLQAVQHNIAGRMLHMSAVKSHFFYK